MNDKPKQRRQETQKAQTHWLVYVFSASLRQGGDVMNCESEEKSLKLVTF